MMTQTIYDKHQQFYIDFVDRMMAAETGFWPVMFSRYEVLLGSKLPGAKVCDVACGEGYLSRHLNGLGAGEVVGVDLSAALIETAVQRSASPRLTYQVDDAQQLNSLSNASFDIVVSQMALMDIPDHRAMFTAVRRILKLGGVFLFSLLHPCFETPFQLPDERPTIEDEDGNPVAFIVRRYGSEGYWQSGGDGVRGHMGAYHRMLSTYINDLIAAGFRIDRIEEPLVEGGGLEAEVPKVVIMVGTAE
jgi:SAM-dependent methyltransferase